MKEQSISHLLVTVAYLAIYNLRAVEQATDLGRDDRERAMLILYMGGFTLRDIGKIFNVSGQRVKQIFDAIGLDRLPERIVLQCRKGGLGGWS